VNSTTIKSNGRGFLALDEARRKEIASMGGRAAHAKGTAHQYTSEEAREAGRKGGAKRAANRLAQLAALRQPATGVQQ
jgi:hypothetical protein